MKRTIFLLFFFSLLFTVLLLYPYSFSISHGVTNVVDPLFYAWNLSHNASNTFSGMAKLLNTNIFYPLTNTLAFSDTLWGQSIITSPIIWLTDNPILAQNVAVLISFPLSAISMFLLSLYLTKNVLASCISGIFFAFSYPRLSQVGHLPMISSQWLPLYLLYLFKFLNEGKRKNFFLVCLWYTLSVASSIYFGVFLIPITAIIIIADICKRFRSHTLHVYKQRFSAIFPSVLFFLVILFIVNFPYIRLKVENPEMKRSIDDMTNLRATPVDYFSVLPTSLISPMLPNNINEHVLYPTLTVLTLAFLGSILAWKRNRYMILLSVIIAISSGVLSLGDQQFFSIGSLFTGTLRLPYYYLYTFFPVFQAIRVPARFSIFVILMLSILAAWGIDAVMKQKRYKWSIAVFLCIFIIEIWQLRTPFISVPLKNSIPDVYVWIQKQPEPMILAELPISLFYFGKTMEKQLSIPYNLLQKEDVYALETYRVYFSAFHKKRMINGYSGFLPDSYNRLTETLGNFPSEDSIQTMQKIGVTHILVHSMQYESVERHEMLTMLTNSPLVSLSYSNSNDLVFRIYKKEIHP